MNAMPLFEHFPAYLLSIPSGVDMSGNFRPREPLIP